MSEEMIKQYYQEAKGILIAVDCVIFGFDIEEEKIKLLLFKRKVEPFKDQWSLVGSFVKENEDLDDSALRVLKEYTGLDRMFLEQHKTYGKIDRDPGARVISTSFWSLIRILDSDKETLNQYNAQWFDLDQIPELILDHADMVRDVLELMAKQALNRPIGFELLPEMFTLPKLLKLYQEILQRPLDDRNFRKKILATGLLKRLDKKDKSTSRKGAFLYQFDADKYNELLNKGFNIEFS